MTQYGFHMRQDLCTGCHACQMACKDEKNLDDARLFRHVFETEGGSFAAAGSGWAHDAFAFYTSMSCNHCERPACLGVCPAGAIAKDDKTGIVTYDGELCIGCKYCEEACSYGAPQYDEAAGKMTKCDLCADRVAAGEQPVCVAACPFNALEFGELEELRAQYGEAVTTFGLPEDTTGPSIAITPHAAGAPAVA